MQAHGKLTKPDLETQCFGSCQWVGSPWKPPTHQKTTMLTYFVTLKSTAVTVFAVTVVAFVCEVNPPLTTVI
jgi:hypothetical protein